MPSTYVHMSGKEVERAILAMKDTDKMVLVHAPHHQLTKVLNQSGIIVDE